MSTELIIALKNEIKMQRLLALPGPGNEACGLINNRGPVQFRIYIFVCTVRWKHGLFLVVAVPDGAAGNLA